MHDAQIHDTIHALRGAELGMAQAERVLPDVSDVLDRAGYVADFIEMSVAELDGRRQQMSEVAGDLAQWAQRIDLMLQRLQRDIDRCDRALLSVRGDDEPRDLI